MSGRRFLIVGGDGLIGVALNEAIRLQGGIVTCTSRRLGADVFLDLQNRDTISSLDVSGYDVAYICAGWSRYAEIELNCELSEQVNVTNTMCLCERLLAACCTVVFISTAAVFDGERPYPAEDAAAVPGTRYGMQKYRVERALTESLQQGGRVKIIRLSKVMSSAMPLIEGWRHALLRGEIITPLSDLRLSPVSLRYVITGLIKIALLEQCGLFHLSGASDVSYSNFAALLASKWGLSSCLVCPSTSRDLSAHLPYAPRYPSLGMSHTEAMAQISPQTLGDCIADLTAQGSL